MYPRAVHSAAIRAETAASLLNHDIPEPLVAVDFRRCMEFTRYLLPTPGGGTT